MRGEYINKYLPIYFNRSKYYFTGKGYYSFIDHGLHRDVWRYYNGEIPKGYIIHHKDKNPHNNDISNLSCVTPKESAKLHDSEERRESRRKNISIGRKYAEVWRKTKEGIKFQKEHAKRIRFGIHKRTKKVCEFCGKEYMGTHTNKFCSTSCQGKHGYRSRVDLVQIECKVCNYCGKEYMSKIRHQKFCSDRCRSKYGARNYLEIRECKVCGKTFSVYKYAPTQTCSKECGAKLGSYTKSLRSRI